MPPVGYIAYIDEAGDDGLRQIKRGGQPGATEWIVLSAVLIKSAKETEVLKWVKHIVAEIAQHQLTHIHYARLPPDKRLLACKLLSELDIRIFVMISHKRNMQGYRNLRVEQSNVNRTARFYIWLSRLLLERVTTYCGVRSFRDYGEYRTVRVEFSTRGGVRLKDLRDYFKYIGDQSRMGMLFNNNGNLDWRVVDVSEMRMFPNNARAGLQLADIAASSFFGGLERTPQGLTMPGPAKVLLPRVCMGENGKRFGFGVKLMPGWLRQLPPEQADLIDFYRSK